MTTTDSSIGVSHEAERLLLLVTPCCGRSVTRCWRPRHATHVVKRKCPACGARWQVTVSPMAGERICDANQWREYHTAVWVRLSGAEVTP